MNMCSYHTYGSVRLSVDICNTLLNGCTKLFSTNPLFLYVESISVFVIMKNNTKDNRASSFSETAGFLFSALLISTCSSIQGPPFSSQSQYLQCHFPQILRLSLVLVRMTLPFPFPREYPSFPITGLSVAQPIISPYTFPLPTFRAQLQAPLLPGTQVYQLEVISLLLMITVLGKPKILSMELAFCI